MTPPPLPTLADTIEAQTDLEALCRDRPVSTQEIFEPNAFYGNDFILKAYSGLLEERSLYCVVPHGPDLDPRFVWAAEERADLPAVLCYPDYRRQVYAALTSKLVIPSAAPYLYCTRLLNTPGRSDRRGTIYFVPHSSHHVIVDQQSHALADSLREADERFRPVTVCIYWKDVLLGRHRPYLEAGFRVVSAGHMYDRLFLFRLHHLCSLHEFSASASVGSQVFYSVHSGCRHLRIPGTASPPPFEMEGAVNSERDALRASECPPLAEVPDVRDLFFREEPPEWDRQEAAAGYFLGRENLQSPTDLARSLRDCRRLDLTGYWFGPNRRLRDLPPTGSRRMVRRTRAALRRGLGRR